MFDATLSLLTARGYQSVTAEAVAAAAGVNKTTIYRNWPTKAALVQAAAADRSAHVITTRISGDPQRDLVAFLTSVAKQVSSPVGQALVIATVNEANDPQVGQARAAFWRARFDAAGALIKSATKDTDAADRLDVEAVIEHLIGPLFLRVFITGAPIDRAFIKKTARAAIQLISCEGSVAGKTGGSVGTARSRATRKRSIHQ